MLLSAPAWGKDGLESRYQIDRLLGEGAFKKVYSVKDHPELALGILTATSFGDYTPEQMARVLDDEKKMLDRLAAHDVPVATILEISTYRGKKAYLQKRFTTGDRAPNWESKKWKVLNETTLEDIGKIHRALVKAHLDVVDAQFLVDDDGHIVVADPLELERRSGWNDADSVLDTIAGEAREAIAERRKKALSKMRGARDPELAEFFESGALEAPTAAEKTKLKEALLHYLETGTTTKLAQEVAGAVRKGDLAIDFVKKAPEGTTNDRIRLVLPSDLGPSFPALASELVRQGSLHLHDGEAVLEREVKAAAHALAFDRAKETPDGLVVDGLHPRGSELAGSPATLFRSVAGDRARSLSGAERVRLVGLARSILERGPRSVGLSRVLEERVADGARDRDRDRSAVER